MFEQLWFTRSRSGFNEPSLNGRAGFQVRAASPGFQQRFGPLDGTQSKFHRKIAPYLRYPLSDRRDQQAASSPLPVSLAFLPTDDFCLVVHKTGIPASSSAEKDFFFSHMLLVEAQKHPYPHAREASAYWGSTFWQTSDGALAADQRDLSAVEPTAIASGSLSASDVVPQIEALRSLVQALLAAPARRVYLGGPSASIAACIWGLTRCLPKTLNSMRKLSFSTYETISEQKDSPYQITGTSWSTPEQDFSDALYSDPQKFVLNCSTTRASALSPSPTTAIVRYAYFAAACLTSTDAQQTRRLTDLLTIAETLKIVEPVRFLNLYLLLEEVETPNLPQIQWISAVMQEHPALLVVSRMQQLFLQGIAAHQDWWNAQDKALLSNLLNATQHSAQRELKEAGVALTSAIVQRLLAAVRANDQPQIAFWINALQAAAPAAISGSIWHSLLVSLRPSTAEQRLADLYTWETRLKLLLAWETVPALHLDREIPPWLVMNWQELGQFLGHTVQRQWHIEAIVGALCLPGRPEEQVADIVAHHEELFGQVMQELLQDSTTASATRQFFRFLVERNYLGKVRILRTLLETQRVESSRLNNLWKDAELLPQEVRALLEEDPAHLVGTQEISPVILEILHTYFSTFNANDIQRSPTRELLRILREQTFASLSIELQGLVRGWSSLSVVLNGDRQRQIRLSDLCRELHAMRLTSSARKQLANVFLPWLAEHILSEADLARVMDHLGEVLMAARIDGVNANLVLLHDLAEQVGQLYTQENQLFRILVYVKMLLLETASLPSPLKESFLDSCLQLLLRNQPQKQSASIEQAASFWSPDARQAWQEHRSRKRDASQSQYTSTLPSNIKPLPMSKDVHIHIIARVNGEEIVYERLRTMYIIKSLYKQYRHYRDSETHDLQKKAPLLTFTKSQIKQESLDDLIDHALICQEISSKITAGVEPAVFEVNGQLPPLRNEFRSYYSPRYNELLRQQQVQDKDIDAALEVFLRRDRFARWLKDSMRKKALLDWLQEKKQGNQNIQVFSEELNRI